MSAIGSFSALTPRADHRMSSRTLPLRFGRGSWRAQSCRNRSHRIDISPTSRSIGDHRRQVLRVTRRGDGPRSAAVPSVVVRCRTSRSRMSREGGCCPPRGTGRARSRANSPRARPYSGPDDAGVSLHDWIMLRFPLVPARAGWSCGARVSACWRGGAGARWRLHRVPELAPARRAPAGTGSGRGLAPAGRSSRCSRQLATPPLHVAAQRRGGARSGLQASVAGRTSSRRARRYSPRSFSRGIHKRTPSWQPIVAPLRPPVTGPSGADWAPAPAPPTRWHRDRWVGWCASLPVFVDVVPASTTRWRWCYLSASDDADVVGIASTAGNVPVQRFAETTSDCWSCARSPVSVSKGSEQPVSTPLRTAEDTHGPEASDTRCCRQPIVDSPRTTPRRPGYGRRGVPRPVGRDCHVPLTDLAFALRIVRRCPRCCGGWWSWVGPLTTADTPVAEWNMSVVPEAAAEVFAVWVGPRASNLEHVRIVLGLNLTENVAMTPTILSRLATAADRRRFR